MLLHGKHVLLVLRKGGGVSRRCTIEIYHFMAILGEKINGRPLVLDSTRTSARRGQSAEQRCDMQ